MNHRPAKIPDGASPIVKLLIMKMHEQGVGVMEMCHEAGITKSAFSNWKRSAPLFETLEACFNVLGHSLVPLPISSDVYHHESKKKREYIVTTPAGNEYNIIGLSEFCRKNNLDPNQMYRIANTGKTHKGFMVKR